MIKFNYEKLFEPADFDEPEEIAALAFIMSTLVEDLDFRDVLIVAKCFCNMSVLKGVPIYQIATNMFGMTNPRDSDLKEFAKQVYYSNSDKLDGASFVLTPLDVLRLGINPSVIRPDKTIKRDHRGQSYMLYLYNYLPFRIISEHNDTT